MKLKLAYYVMSRAKHFLQPQEKEFDRAGILIRHRALHAATRCATMGRNTDIQLHKSLKEFLAFFCVITLNEIAIKSNQQSDVDLKQTYAKLIKAVSEGPEPDPNRLSHQLVVSRITTYKKSGFDHWFFGYWNADFQGMQITDGDLGELKQKRIQLPSGSASADAGLILLVRLARLHTRNSTLPETSTIRLYDQAIREEVTEFVRALKDVLR